MSIHYFVKYIENSIKLLQIIIFYGKICKMMIKYIILFKQKTPYIHHTKRRICFNRKEVLK